MNISQEILVLDFGDEKREFFKADPSTDFAKGKIIKISWLLKSVVTVLLFHSIYRQDCHHHRAVSHEDIGPGPGRHLCSDDPALHLHLVLLLHEKVDAAPQDRSIRR